ncbi:MAG: WYL domain-containing protein [Ruminococcus flavefaciens]|nr:WYL domain-containing protein [Ruminococcus flavefaciens]
MDDVTRALFLYSKLIEGKSINKAVFTMEYNCSNRTFDRDIERIRIFLSESYSVSELIYDRGRNAYYMSGTEKSELDLVEYLFLKQILRDTAVLREDEFKTLMSHLLSGTEKSKSFDLLKNEPYNGYRSPLHNKALLKIHKDLVLVIQYRKCIRMKYFKSDGEEVERNVIPCAVRYDLGYLYLIGYREDKMDEYPAYFRLDRIYSFEITRSQTIREQEKIRIYMENYFNGMVQMYGGSFVEITIECKEDYFSYVCDKFRNAEIVEQDKELLIVKIGAFEDGFIRWLMGQSQDRVALIGPESTKNKLVENARTIIKKYGGKG